MTEENTQRNNWLWVFLLVFVILIIQGLFWLITYSVFHDWSKSGVFGDAFGFLNTLFAGFAFAGIIYTIYLQQKELSLQREELRMTREELRKSTEAQEESQKAQKKLAEINLNRTLLEYYNSEIGFVNSAEGTVQMAGMKFRMGYHPDNIKSILNKREKLFEKVESLIVTHSKE